MTDWQRILLAADHGAEIAATRRRKASSMTETQRWKFLEARLNRFAEFALLAIEFNA